MFKKSKLYLSLPSYNHIAHPVLPFWWCFMFVLTAQMYSRLCVPNLKLSHSFSYLWLFHICQLKNMFMKQSLHELTMRYLVSEISIFLELLPLSFGAVEQNSQRNEMSLFMIPWIHIYEKKTTSACEDCWRPCNPPLFSYLGILGPRFL
jgi:hypothetical protein